MDAMEGGRIDFRILISSKLVGDSVDINVMTRIKGEKLMYPADLFNVNNKI
jgi:hypothetical protein